MASYHCTMKSASAGKGAAHFDYIAREGRYEEGEKAEELVQDGKWSENMPPWAAENPRDFWQAADDYERANGRAYSEIEIALPNELTMEQNKEFVRDFCREQFGEDFAYSVAIHQKTAALDGEKANPHAHIMFCERRHDGIERDAQTFFRQAARKNEDPATHGAKKDRERWNDKNAVERVRESYERLQNLALERAGHEVRVSRLSLADQRDEAIRRGDRNKALELDREPEKHVGPATAAKKDKNPLTAEDIERIAENRATRGLKRDVKNEAYQVNKEKYELRKEESEIRKLERQLERQDREAQRLAEGKPPTTKDLGDPVDREALAERRQQLEDKRAALYDRELVNHALSQNLEREMQTPEMKAEIEKQKENIVAREQRDQEKLQITKDRRYNEIEKELRGLHDKIERPAPTPEQLTRMATARYLKRNNLEKVPETPEAKAGIEKIERGIAASAQARIEKRPEFEARRAELEKELLPLRAERGELTWDEAEKLGAQFQADRTKAEQERTAKEAERAAKEQERAAKEAERAREVREAQNAITTCTGYEAKDAVRKAYQALSAERSRLQSQLSQLPKNLLTEEKIQTLSQEVLFKKATGITFEEFQKAGEKLREDERYCGISRRDLESKGVKNPDAPYPAEYEKGWKSVVYQIDPALKNNKAEILRYQKWNKENTAERERLGKLLDNYKNAARTPEGQQIMKAAANDIRTKNEQGFKEYQGLQQRFTGIDRDYQQASKLNMEFFKMERALKQQISFKGPATLENIAKNMKDITKQLGHAPEARSKGHGLAPKLNRGREDDGLEL